MAIQDRYAYVASDDPWLGRQAAAYRAHQASRGKQARRQRALIRIETNLIEKQADLALLVNRCNEIIRELDSGEMYLAERDSLLIRMQRAQDEIKLLRQQISSLQKEAQILRSRLR